MEKLIGALLRLMARVLTLIFCATLGGVLVFVGCMAFYGMVFKGGTLSDVLSPRISDTNFLAGLLMLGVGTGIIGFGYIHTFLAYLLFLRRIPDFWQHIVAYFVKLVFGTLLISIVCMLMLFFDSSAAFGSIMFCPAIGFWMTSAFLFLRNRKTKGKNAS